MSPTTPASSSRVDWVDAAKGFCIVLVVMMHSTLGVEAATGETGWMHAVVAFAKPFRMPDFFLISGLFLARVIDRDWKTYLDRKVVHFAYFYVLWVTIQFAVKAPGLAETHGAAGVASLYLQAFVQPFGTLWFIYLLPVFFVVTWALRVVSPLVVVGIAAALEIAPIDTGAVLIDEFAARFVYFYLGYVLAGRVFALAAEAQAKPAPALSLLVMWGALNNLFVQHGWSDLPVISLGLGLFGAAAVVTAAALLAGSPLAAPLRCCGQHSIVVYLAFFLPMAASRAFLLKAGLVADIGTVSLLVTTAGVGGALLIRWATQPIEQLGFLFVRPAVFRLAPARREALQAAE